MKAATEVHADFEVPRPAIRPASIPVLIQQLLVSRYAPTAVFVNARGEVVYIHGHTGTYLEPAPGPPTHHLLEMAREGLQHDLALALHMAARKGDVVRHDVRMKANGGVILVNVTVKKITEPEPLEGLFLVTFEQAQG